MAKDLPLSLRMISPTQEVVKCYYRSNNMLRALEYQHKRFKVQSVENLEPRTPAKLRRSSSSIAGNHEECIPHPTGTGKSQNKLCRFTVSKASRMRHPLVQRQEPSVCCNWVVRMQGLDFYGDSRACTGYCHSHGAGDLGLEHFTWSREHSVKEIQKGYSDTERGTGPVLR